MDEVGICVVIHNNYFTTRYNLENLLRKTKVKTRLYIVDLSSEEKHLSEFCKQLCSTTGGYYKLIDQKKKYSEALNDLLRIVTQKHVVIFPVNGLVHQNWLEDLLYYQKMIPSIGITSIRSSMENLNWIPLIHSDESKPEDELRNVLITENNSTEGILCFQTDKLLRIGYFDEKLQHSGFEQAEFSFRMASIGLNNIYIRKQTYIRTALYDDILFPKKSKLAMDEFKMNIDWMIKNQIFKK